MKKAIIILLGLILFLIGKVDAQAHSVSITGTIAGLGSDTVRLLDADFKEIKSVISSQDHFEMNVEVNTEDMRLYSIHLPSLGGLGPSMVRTFISFFICSNKIELLGHIDEGSFSEDQILGSPCQSKYDSLYKNLKSTSIIEKAGKLYNVAFEAYNNVSKSKENRETLRTAGNLLDDLFGVQKDEIYRLARKYPEDLVIATLATQYSPPSTKDVNEMKGFIDMFSPVVLSNSYYMQQLLEKFKSLSAVSVGQIAPEFTLSDTQDKKVSLSDFKGKYVLVDFWASWCAPCRKENPNIVKAYDEYKKKGFEVLAIAVFDTHTNWLKAIEEDKTPFTHVIDIDDRGNSVASIFQVTAIPANFLLDPEGKIIGKDLRGESLQKKLSEIFR